MRSIFDGHLDLALFALAYNRDMTEPAAVSNQREEGMTDALDRGLGAVSLPDMRRGRVAVCQSSLAARVNREARPVNRLDLDFRHPEHGLCQRPRPIVLLPGAGGGG